MSEQPYRADLGPKLVPGKVIRKELEFVTVQNPDIRSIFSLHLVGHVLISGSMNSFVRIY